MTTNRPAWMQIGQPVAVNGGHWRGLIVDVAVSDKGVIMVQVDSPKGVLYNTPPEWLEHHSGQIKPCSHDDLELEAARYSLRLQEKTRETGRFSVVAGA